MAARIVTFSRNVFLPLTTVCRNRCGYCVFRTPVREGCVMEPGKVTSILRGGAELGCTEALFTFGERPGEEPGFGRIMARMGYRDILEYCAAMCTEGIGAGLLPHTNAGVMTEEELAFLQPVNASMGLMLETTARVEAHCNSPGKDPDARIDTIEAAGRLRIPFTTGLLIGIGETWADRDESLAVIRDLHRRYGHIQEVIIQNFCPKDGTGMAGVPGPGPGEMAEVVSLAREILPHGIAIQAPPNLIGIRDLIERGVTDLGGVSPLTIDYVNPEHPWPGIDRLRQDIGDAVLAERLCIYPQYIRKKWYPPLLEPLITRLAQRVQQELRE